MANLQAELNQFFKAKVLRTWIGYAKACDKKNAVRVVVPHSVFEDKINAFFKERTTFFVYDPEKKVKPGDTVLIKELAEKKTTLITHELIRILYPRGDVTDPITGRKVMNIRYNDVRFRDDQEKLIKFFGESPNRFIYEKAPPRGWQEGKRDITGKVVEVHYHDDGKQDPYKVNIRPNFCRPEVEFPNPKK